jgi:hypothetical protein
MCQSSKWQPSYRIPFQNLYTFLSLLGSVTTQLVVRYRLRLFTLKPSNIHRVKFYDLSTIYACSTLSPVAACSPVVPQYICSTATLILLTATNELVSNQTNMIKYQTPLQTVHLWRICSSHQVLHSAPPSAPASVNRGQVTVTDIASFPATKLHSLFSTGLIISMLSGSPVTWAWHVPRLWAEEMASRYGG